MADFKLDQLLLRLLARVELFADLERQEMVALLALAQKAQFQTGEIIFREGERGESLFVLVAGQLEVVRGNLQGEHWRLALIDIGTVVGELALIDSEPRSASVRALVPSIALGIARSSLKNKPEIAAKLYRNLARVLAQKLRQTNDELLTRL